MPSRAESTRRQHPTRKPASRPRRTGTKALAVSESVLHGEISRSMLDNQIELLGAMLAWSPARLLVHQQAAFWRGVAGESSSSAAPAERPRLAKRKSVRASAKARNNGAGKGGRKAAADGDGRSARKPKRLRTRS